MHYHTRPGRATAIPAAPPQRSAMSAVIDLLAAVVAIDSVSPAYGGPGEAALGRHLLEHCRRHGIEAFTQPVLPGRDNVVAVVPGRDRSRRIVLEAHMDTVSVAGMTIPPFEPVIRDGRLHGRGACDTKGGLAAMLQAVTDLASGGPPPPCDVWFAAVVDEEHAYRGVVALCDGLVADAAIVAEPTSLRIVTATKGVVRFPVITTGRAAHSSRPELGVSAVTAAARIVLALESFHARLAARTHPLLGRATGSIGTIQGGVQVNIVPESCTLAIDRRLLPGETPDAALAEYRAVVEEVAAAHPDVRAEIGTPLLVDEPLETAADAAVVRTARAVAVQVGLDDTVLGVPYGSDASKLSRRGIGSIVFGPGRIDQAHAAVEYVPLEEVEQATAFYGRFIRSFGSDT